MINYMSQILGCAPLIWPKSLSLFLTESKHTFVFEDMVVNM